MYPRRTILIVFLLLIIGPAYAAVAPAGHDITFINDCSRQVGIVFDESNYDQSTSHLPSCKPRQTDPPLCWDGTQCGGEGCCPPIAETNNQPYNCPGIKHKGANCPNSTPFKSGYQNPALHKSPAACSGPVLGASVNGSIMLNTGQKRTITFPAYWNGAFYTRTDCTFDADGYGSCLTGDCTKYGWGYRECAGAPSLPPATKGEFNFDIPPGHDWYDVSYVNGFNIAMVITPTRYDPAYPGSDPASASRQCTAAGCSVGLADFKSPEVPSWDVLKYPSATNFLAINDNCDLYVSYRGSSNWSQDVEDGYCCPAARGYVNDPSHCNDDGVGKPCRTCAGQHTNMYPFTLKGALPNSAKIFYQTCPTAYAYTYNDTDALFTCKGNTSFPSAYTVTLSCPVKKTVSVSTTLSEPLLSDSHGTEPAMAAVLSPGGDDDESLGFIFSDYSRSGGSSATSDTTVHHIHVNITNSTGETILRVERNPDLGMVPELTGHSFAIYYRIESPHLESSRVGSALIEFSVNVKTLSSLGLNPEDIVLLHWDGTRWAELPTAFEYSTGGRAYYSATTPGFSYFAISTRGMLRESPAATSIPLTVLPSLSSVPDVIATNPVSKNTVPVKTPAVSRESPAVPANLSPVSPAGDTAPGIPALAVGIILIGCCLIGGGWYTRRWWIRRQNPALFEDMD